MAYGRATERLVNKHQLFKGDGSKFLPLHNWLHDDMRNDYVGHSNASDFHLVNVVGVVKGNPFFAKEFQIINHLSFAMVFDLREIDNVIALLDYLIPNLISNLSKQMEHVEREATDMLAKRKVTAFREYRVIQEFPEAPDIVMHGEPPTMPPL